MILHILLAYFSITVTIKHLDTFLNGIRKEKQKQTSQIRTSLQPKQIMIILVCIYIAQNLIFHQNYKPMKCNVVRAIYFSLIQHLRKYQNKFVQLTVFIRGLQKMFSLIKKISQRNTIQSELFITPWYKVAQNARPFLTKTFCLV